MNIFYVYQLIDPRTNLPFYVGKGKNDRMYEHVRLAKCPGGIKHNTYLERKIRSILRDGHSIKYKKIYTNLSEPDALRIEAEIIDLIGLDNLCNLTNGGIGGDCITNHPNYNNICKKMGDSRRGKKRSPEVVERIKLGLNKWRSSPQAKQYFKNLSKDRMGTGNPMYGRVEDKEHKNKRMKNFLDTPRWNTGLTKETDSRIAKLSVWSGKLPPNALTTTITNVITGEVVTGKSLKDTAQKSKISTSSMARLRSGKIQQTETGWIYNGSERTYKSS